MNRTLKIALLTDGITPFVTGGMQRHSANLAKYLTIAGVEVTLVHCVAYNEKVPSADKVNKELFGNENFALTSIIGLRFPPPGKMPGHYVRNSYTYAKTVYESLDFRTFDFVIAKGFVGWHYMKMKSDKPTLPPIGVKFHGYEMFQTLPSISQKLKAKLLRKATRWNNQNADYVFSYGGKITELILREFNLNQAQIIEFTSGIDSSWLRASFESQTDELVKFVFVGRYERRKGVEELTNVLRKLTRESFKFEMHFVGPIPDEKKIKSEKIVYHGLLNSRAEICAILDDTDVLLCPSHSEGMPNVILEGMARGNAILATKVGAVECLVNQTCGWFVEPGNETSLFNTMVEIMRENKGQIEVKRKKAHERVEKEFKWTQLASGMIAKIEAIVES